MQYIDLDLYREELSPIRLLSILTRLNYDILSNLPCDEFILKVMPELKWIGEQYDVFSARRKKEIQIGNYLFDTIIDVGKERLGQNLLYVLHSIFYLDVQKVHNNLQLQVQSINND